MQPITILMAEDDPDDRLLIGEAFKESGVPSDLRFVSDGQELMDYLGRRGPYREPADSPSPDFILLDLNMPRKDGREVLAEIKTNPRFCGFKVIVLSTSNEEKDVQLSARLGAVTFITKPASFPELVNVVKSLQQMI